MLSKVLILEASGGCVMVRDVRRKGRRRGKGVMAAIRAFFMGMRSSFELFPPANHGQFYCKNDQAGLASDWRAIGDDFRVAVVSYRNEQEIQKKSSAAEAAHGR